MFGVKNWARLFKFYWETTAYHVETVEYLAHGYDSFYSFIYLFILFISISSSDGHFFFAS